MLFRHNSQAKGPNYSTFVVTHRASFFYFSNPLHVVMWALFQVALYSFFHKSNLVVDRAAQVSSKVILRSDLRFDASFAYVSHSSCIENY